MPTRERQAGDIKAALEAAADLIAKWDQDGGLTYPELAARLFDIYMAAVEKGPEVAL